VVTLRKELTRQPASQCRSSTLTIFIGSLLDNAIQIIRKAPIIPGRAAARDGRRFVRRVGVGILYRLTTPARARRAEIPPPQH
jgi:hypothetical protein